MEFGEMLLSWGIEVGFRPLLGIGAGLCGSTGYEFTSRDSNTCE